MFRTECIQRNTGTDTRLSISQELLQHKSHPITWWYCGRFKKSQACTWAPHQIKAWALMAGTHALVLLIPFGSSCCTKFTIRNLRNLRPNCEKEEILRAEKEKGARKDKQGRVFTRCTRLCIQVLQQVGLHFAVVLDQWLDPLSHTTPSTSSNKSQSLETPMADPCCWGQLQEIGLSGPTPT